MSYARYQPVIEQARSQPALWRLLVGLALVVFVSAGWTLGILAILALRTGTPFSQATEFLPFLGLTPSGTALFLFLYVGLGYGTLIAAQALHGRSPRSIIGPPARTLRHFAIAAATSLALLCGLTLVTLPIPPAPIQNLDLGTWLLWLPLGALVVAAQTGSEEILFRGYMQSQIAARFRGTWTWLLLPSLAFGALHTMPTLPLAVSLAYAGAATCFGLMAADLTARTGSIGAAWGFHFGNNAFAILIIAADANISGLGLLRAETAITDIIHSPAVLVFELFALLAIWALIRRFVSA